MKQFFLDLKIRNKLLVGFIVISLVLIGEGIREYNVIKSLQDSDIESMRNSQSAQIIKEVKYELQAEMYIAIELITSKDLTETDRWWSLHAEHSITISEQLDQIENISYQNTNTLLVSLYEKVIAQTNDIETEYNNTFLTSLQKARDLKLKLFDISNKPPDDSDSLAVMIYESQQNDRNDLEEQLSELDNFLVNSVSSLIKKLDEVTVLIQTAHETSDDSRKEYINTSLWQTLVTIVAGLIITLLIAIYISNLISGTVEKLSERMLMLSKGELPDSLVAASHDEIGDMTESLNMLVEGLRRTSNFASEIGKGNYSSEFKPLSEKDVLGNSLLEMRQSLHKAQEDQEKRAQEDEQRSWMTEGLTKFADILRKSSGEISELANNVIINMVKYMNANQGGLFIYNDNNKDNLHLELLASYAYNRKKYIDKKILLGEGLVGVCALEKYTIFLTEIPDDYIEIESGLGLSNPKSLLIVPLKIDEQILGVVELASFNTFEKHEIELAERIAESVASAFATIKINLRTAQLLEQSQLQAEEMHKQEESMRQTIRQMEENQEETLRREQLTLRHLDELREQKQQWEQNEVLQRKQAERVQNELKLEIDMLNRKLAHHVSILENSPTSVITFTESGVIEYVNPTAQHLTGYSDTELIGKNIRQIVPTSFHDSRSHVLISTTDIADRDNVLPIRTKDAREIKVSIMLIETLVNHQRRYTAFIEDVNKSMFNDVFDVGL